MRLLLQRYGRPRSGLGRLPHIALGMAGLINTVAQFFIAGAVVGRAALRADDHIVFRGKLFAAGRAGIPVYFTKIVLLIGTLPNIIVYPRGQFNGLSVNKSNF